MSHPLTVRAYTLAVMLYQADMSKPCPRQTYTMPELESLLSCGARTVQGSIKELEDTGVIGHSRGPLGTSLHHFDLAPEHWIWGYVYYGLNGGL